MYRTKLRISQRKKDPVSQVVLLVYFSAPCVQAMRKVGGAASLQRSPTPYTRGKAIIKWLREVGFWLDLFVDPSPFSVACLITFTSVHARTRRRAPGFSATPGEAIRV